MEVMNNYADLLRLIDLVRAEIDMLEKDHKLSVEKRERWSARSNRLKHRISQLQNKLEHYVVIEEEIRLNIEKLEGLPYKIAKLRFIDGHSYNEVADILGYSYSHIRKVVSKCNQDEYNEETTHVDNL